MKEETWFKKWKDMLIFVIGIIIIVFSYGILSAGYFTGSLNELGHMFFSLLLLLGIVIFVYPLIKTKKVEL